MLNFLQSRDQFLILTHKRPDGDTLGSAAGLCAGLRCLGKTAYVARNPETTLRYLPYVEPLFPPEGFTAQTVVTVDVAAPELIPKIWQALQIDARIDHHLTRETFAPVSYVDEGAAACGEIILELLQALKVPLTKELAAPLYLAITTDTGCFRYSSTTAKTHAAAAALFGTGFSAGQIDEMVFSCKSHAQVAVESAVLQDMEFLSDGRIAIGTLSLERIQKAGAAEDDLEMVSSLPRLIRGVAAGVTIRQEKVGCKLSVRTMAPYDANLICAQMGGGGHARAAGCRTPDADMAEARRMVLDALEACYPGEFEL